VLGRLQHPGIAQIHEAGTAEGPDGPQPFFAMELARASKRRSGESECRKTSASGSASQLRSIEEFRLPRRALALALALPLTRGLAGTRGQLRLDRDLALPLIDC